MHCNLQPSELSKLKHLAAVLLGTAEIVIACLHRHTFIKLLSPTLLAADRISNVESPLRSQDILYPNTFKKCSNYSRWQIILIDVNDGWTLHIVHCFIK